MRIYKARIQTSRLVGITNTKKQKHKQKLLAIYYIKASKKMFKHQPTHSYNNNRVYNKQNNYKSNYRQPVNIAYNNHRANKQFHQVQTASNFFRNELTINLTKNEPRLVINNQNKYANNNKNSNQFAHYFHSNCILKFKF